MQAYKVLITIEVLRMQCPNRSERDLILSFLENLSANPECIGDYADRDGSGRLVQIKILGDYAITYWADHAVKEVKVTSIEKAD